ncbi:MAG: ATP-binding cassette domain-containing protein [Candidatus Paceibacterota bacterium]|jgi:cell division transport system ATP-binding protein|nr:ATP-binding cassette domain-containing protein [Candidatus Paceibacterota bacterium]MDD4831078.1 ATP-binding cassette domain-containing protein [Candidatus Paceibacterota bacterium]MDD4875038.1 ATP-binding cassette domain-containing protein [Candidatus Paceibacterota bacterium]
MIKLENISKIYPLSFSREQKAALQNVSFDVESGEFITFCGRSGAGKTTLLKIIACQEKPTDGNVFFEGEDLCRTKDKDICSFRHQIGFVFQDYKLLSYKTVFENVSYALEVTDYQNGGMDEEVEQILELVGLQNQTNSFPHELSGGEKQRVAIARALIHRPKVVLADEPTGNLDPYHTRDILKIFNKVNEMGTTILLATHSKEIVNSLQRRVITIEDGEIRSDEAKGRFIL